MGAFAYLLTLLDFSTSLTRTANALGYASNFFDFQARRLDLRYRGEDGKESFRLPEKRYGVAFVFRVFERVSYALVMESDGPVTIGDTLRKP